MNLVYKNLHRGFLLWLLAICPLLSLAQKEKDSLKVLLNEAYDLYDEGAYGKSVAKGRELLSKAYEENNQIYVAEAYYFLGINDETTEKYDKAKEKYLKALAIAEAKKDTNFILNIYNGLGNIAALQDKDKVTAESYYLKGIAIANQTNDPIKMMFIINICWDYLDEKHSEKVTPYLKELYDYVSDHENNLGNDEEDLVLSSVYFILGRYKGQHQEYDLAHSYLKKSIDLSGSYKRYEMMSDAAFADAEFYKTQNKLDSAYIQLLNYNDYYKKNMNEDMLQNLQAEEAKFNVDEYERALELSEKENELVEERAHNQKILLRVYIVISGILLGFIFMFYRQNVKKKKLIIDLNKKNKELEKAKKEAAIAAEAKTNFVSNVSHELRTPLHGVIGITSLLLSEDEISPKNKKLLKSLKFSGDYLLGLINNVLLFTKIDRNKIKVTPRVVEVKHVLNHIQQTVSYVAERKNVKLHFSIGANVPKELELDEGILSEILINLIDNAVKFSPDGDVYISVEKSPLKTEVSGNEKAFRFTVRDTGVGIPTDKKIQIFHKFSQVYNEESIMEGTGLGLSIVKSLLLQLGTDIVLESEEGKGALFYFDLICNVPIAKTTKDLADGITQDSVNLYEGKQILLVEDNEINKLVTEKFLASYGVVLEIASDGAEGWKKIQENTYDLILLDINIPIKNGYEIAKATRDFNINTPIVAVTASELTEIEAKVYEVGMNDILIKPFNKESIQNILSKYLD